MKLIKKWGLASTLILGGLVIGIPVITTLTSCSAGIHDDIYDPTFVLRDKISREDLATINQRIKEANPKTFTTSVQDITSSSNPDASDEEKLSLRNTNQELIVALKGKQLIISLSFHQWVFGKQKVQSNDDSSVPNKFMEVQTDIDYITTCTYTLVAPYTFNKTNVIKNFVNRIDGQIQESEEFPYIPPVNKSLDAAQLKAEMESLYNTGKNTEVNFSSR